jgi:hypothetical protein
MHGPDGLVVRHRCNSLTCRRFDERAGWKYEKSQGGDVWEPGGVAASLVWPGSAYPPICAANDDEPTSRDAERTG